MTWGMMLPTASVVIANRKNIRQVSSLMSAKLLRTGLVARKFIYPPALQFDPVKPSTTPYHLRKSGRSSTSMLQFNAIVCTISITKGINTHKLTIETKENEKPSSADRICRPLGDGRHPGRRSLAQRVA